MVVEGGRVEGWDEGGLFGGLFNFLRMTFLPSTEDSTELVTGV